MKQRTISVCMTTYNGQKYITEQMNSILHQNYAPDEVIICDDHSEDETVKQITCFIAEHKLEKTWHLYCNEQKKGYPENAYYAMSLCRGDIVFLADQDDIWQEDKLQTMYDTFAAQEDLKLLASKWGIIDGAGKVVSRAQKASGALNRVSVSQIFLKYEWPGMSMCYENTFGKKVAEELANSGIPHDMALALKAAELQQFASMDVCLQYHRNHEENVAMEEHRLFKLLNKKRKLMEIDHYLNMLDKITRSSIFTKEDNRKLARKKQEILIERKNNLVQKKLISIIMQYFNNKDMIRSATMFCDCFICGQKG